MAEWPTAGGLSARILWLWVTVSASVCNLDPSCTCNGGKLQCDCSQSPSKVITMENGIIRDYFTTSISVANCGRVHVASRALSGLPALQQVSFTNIASLTMEEQAFSWTTEDPRHSGVAVDISHSNVPEIPSYTFRGSLREIVLTDVNISQTRPFAFAAIDHADKLQFTRVRFADIDPQTFKKFNTNILMFIDSFISVLRRRTIVNVEVLKEARLENVKADRIESTAISLHGVQNFKLTKSIINQVDGYAIILHSKGDISINDNSFSYLKKNAFLGLTVDDKHLRDTGKEDLVFENNTLIQVDNGALAFNTTGFDIRMDWIRLNQPCSCASVDSWLDDLVIFYSNPNVIRSAAQLNTIMYCMDPKPSRVIDYQTHNCEMLKSSSSLMTVLITVGVILVIVTIAVYCVVQRRGKRYITVPNLSPLKLAETNKAHILVVPDGKTYRETELHVIVEHAEPIVSTEYVKERPDTSDQ